ncbi:hypothetical protein GCM10027047_23140 [Rhodococcus aerolatus]
MPSSDLPDLREDHLGRLRSARRRRHGRGADVTAVHLRPDPRAGGRPEAVVPPGMTGARVLTPAIAGRP